MPTKVKTAADLTAAAEERIGEARARLAATNMRRRELQIEIGHLEDAVSQELYRAGRAGDEPQGVAEKRTEIFAGAAGVRRSRAGRRGPGKSGA